MRPLHRGVGCPRADHTVAEVLDRSCRTAGFQPRIAFHANDYQEAQAMVSVGLGIALAPQTAVTNPHPDVRVIPLGTTAPRAGSCWLADGNASMPQPKR